jgi:hypothetical protein
MAREEIEGACTTKIVELLVDYTYSGCVSTDWTFVGGKYREVL